MSADVHRSPEHIDSLNTLQTNVSLFQTSERGRRGRRVQTSADVYKRLPTCGDVCKRLQTAAPPDPPLGSAFGDMDSYERACGYGNGWLAKLWSGEKYPTIATSWMIDHLLPDITDSRSSYDELTQTNVNTYPKNQQYSARSNDRPDGWLYMQHAY